MKRRIAILFHKEDRRRKLSCYQIYHLSRIWRELGIKVDFVFGVDKFVPADLAILHIDLSVVPDEYLELARRYPFTLNRDVVDIRKSTNSRNLLRAQDFYRGPVIVKSNLNYAGLPERRLKQRRLAHSSRLRHWLHNWYQTLNPEALRFDSAQDYRIYDDIHDVPKKYLKRPELVVERFLPEQEGELFFVRIYQFLGDRETCTRITSKHPIISSVTCIGRETVEPHPEIVSLRHSLGFDYGKFDYVIHRGMPVLFDTNKTVGRGWSNIASNQEARWRHRAEGIFTYFDH
ncbi:MAG: hypothetical protein QNI86_12855 [Halieaceae bacterium]|nr:hypothetical protein [Halieaceae bacterium]